MFKPTLTGTFTLLIRCARKRTSRHTPYAVRSRPTVFRFGRRPLLSAVRSTTARYDLILIIVVHDKSYRSELSARKLVSILTEDLIGMGIPAFRPDGYLP